MALVSEANPEQKYEESDYFMGLPELIAAIPLFHGLPKEQRDEVID
jgi:hypothetical protein